MTTQKAKICPTCQFVEITDQDDHSCMTHLIQRNKELIAERVKLYDLLDRIKPITGEALQFYVHNQKPPDKPVEFLPLVEAIGKEITL